MLVGHQYLVIYIGSKHLSSGSDRSAKNDVIMTSCYAMFDRKSLRETCLFHTFEVRKNG